MAETVKPPVEEEKPKKTDEIEELMDKMYKVFAELGKTLESLSTYISSGKEAQRGLVEAVGKMNERLDILADKVEKLSVSFDQAFSAQTKGRPEQYVSAGGKTPEASGVGETVTVGVTGPFGTPHVEKAEVKKVSTPSVPAVANPKPTDTSGINEVIKGILSGKITVGEASSKVWEVLKR